MLLKFTLNVTAGGLGNVRSNPPGIDCTDNTGACSFSFNAGTDVALLATPRPNDENGTYSFHEWSGDASGTLPAAALTMDGPKNVTAQFVGLGIPLVLWSIPAGQDSVYYHPVAEPVTRVGSLAQAKPLSIGAVPSSVNLSLKLETFDTPVNIYAGVSVDGWNDIVLFGPGGTLHLLSSGLVAWKQNWTAAIDESLTGDLPGLAAGTYRAFVMVADVVDSANFFAWQTYWVETPLFPTNPFLLNPF